MLMTQRRYLLVIWIGLMGMVATLPKAYADSVNQCSSTLLLDTFYSLKPYMGTSVQKISWQGTSLFLPEIQADWASELGEGAEGTVYRVQPMGGTRSYLLKTFHPGEEDGVAETRKLLGYWQELTTELPHETKIQIVAPRRGPLPYTLVYDDVRGESIQRILESDQYSEHLKGRLVRKLMAALGDYIEAMITTHPHVRLLNCCLASDHWDSTYHKYLDVVPEFYGLESSVDSGVYIYFSPNNILFDSEKDRFVILDPV